MAKTKVSGAGQPRVRARGQGKKKTAGPTMPLMAFVTWTDPQKKPVPLYLDVQYDPVTETGHICMTIKLRSVASIEFRPVRRPLVDASGRVSPGHVEDAIRLANATT